MTATEHELKCWPPYFDHMVRGRKRFDVRPNDRNFREGDLVWLREFSEEDGYTGRHTIRVVTYVLPGGQFGIEDGYVVLGLG